MQCEIIYKKHDAWIINKQLLSTKEYFVGILHGEQEYKYHEKSVKVKYHRNCVNKILNITLYHIGIYTIVIYHIFIYEV